MSEILNDTQKSAANIPDALMAELQQNLTKTVAQAIHDIQSPLLCLLIPYMQHNEESLRLNSQEMANRINRIIKNIPLDFQNRQSKESQLISVKEIIEKTIIAKQYEYTNSGIVFKHNINLNASNAIIRANITDFERMLSNITNNAAESYCGAPGIVNINVHSDSKFVYLAIAEDGCGMPDAIKEKILNNITVTNGKTNGQGLGFEQISQTLINCNGSLNIESKESGGTIIILTFPKIIQN